MKTPLQILQEYWGYPAFRSLQEQIINTVTEGKDVMALLPTGGGKSLCYQVPALLLPGLTLVISPLIALIKDQVTRLRSLNIEADAVYSGLHHREIDRILENARYGKTKLLYVSPERLKTEIFKARIAHLNINLIAVDEAHCISQWGHDFRPAYLDIGEIRQQLRSVPLLALTASATKEVKEEILSLLLMDKAVVFSDSFARPNLHYHVMHRQDHLPYIEKMLHRIDGSSIVYVRHRRKSKDLAEWFSFKGISADAYHGGMEMKERDKIQDKWLKGETKTIISTNAFGMGVDKSNVRLVVHYDLPPGIEDYYQEAGRAGRDGKDAYCAIVVKPSSISNLQSRVEAAFPEPEYIKRVYKSLHIYLDLAVGSGLGETFDFDLEVFAKRFNLKSAEAFQALDIIAKDGWISMDESGLRSSQVQFISDVNTLYQYQLADANCDLLTKALLRGYEGLWNAPIYISEDRIAKFLDWDEKKVRDYLQALHLKGLIEYRIPKAKSQITLLRERVPEANFTIDMKAYAFRKERAFRRMQSMINYLADDVVCREAYLRNYFGEQQADECGKCDRCEARKKDHSVSGPDVQEILSSQDGVTVKDFLSQYKTKQQNEIKRKLRQLADEHKIKIVEDRIFKIE